jgi:hypothetical protein
MVEGPLLFVGGCCSENWSQAGVTLVFLVTVLQLHVHCPPLSFCARLGRSLPSQIVCSLQKCDAKKYVQLSVTRPFLRSVNFLTVVMRDLFFLQELKPSGFHTAFNAEWRTENTLSAFLGNAQERRVVMAQGNHSGKHWLEWSNLSEHQLKMCLCWCDLGQTTCLCHEITARNSCSLQSHHPQLWHLQCIPQGWTMLQETSSIELLVLGNCRVAYNLQYQRIEQCIQL